MKSAVVSRLIHSSSSISRSLGSCVVRNERLLSTDSNNRVEENFKAEEAESVRSTRRPLEKLLVLGGNGYVGSHVCKEALDRGLSVSSISRSGRSSIRDPWADRVEWHRGNILVLESWKDALNDVTAVISCVGGFGSNSQMYTINGTANINAIRAAAEKGVKRFVYISAADFGIINYLLKGYYEGKRAAEAELLSKFANGGVILRPGFIYGTRQVGSLKIPLGLIGSPMKMILQHAKLLTRIPLVGPLFTSPVSVTSVSKVAVKAATMESFDAGIVDVQGILRHSEQE